MTTNNDSMSGGESTEESAGRAWQLATGKSWPKWISPENSLGHVAESADDGDCVLVVETDEVLRVRGGEFESLGNYFGLMTGGS